VTALDTGSEDLLAEVDEGVAVITMNRPSRRNAFSDSMSELIRWEAALVASLGRFESCRGRSGDR
jgi:enoyl-CoA hydratase/carnithine racemase